MPNNSRSQGPFVAVDKLVKIIAEKCPQSFEQMLERMAGLNGLTKAKAARRLFCRHF